MTVVSSRRPPAALPRPLRNRLAELILASLQDAGARRRLDELADSPEAVFQRWLPADARAHAGAVTARAVRAAAAVATRPLDREARGLADPLGDAAAASLVLLGIVTIGITLLVRTISRQGVVGRTDP